MDNLNSPAIRWGRIAVEGQELLAAVSPRGLCYLQFDNVPFADFAGWAGVRYPGLTLMEDTAALELCGTQLREYFQGRRTSFSWPLDLQGTAFQRSVWQALEQVPYGDLRTYSQLAEQLRMPRAARAVGAAVGANPVLLAVPCHRIVGKNGQLTGYRGGVAAKALLLRLEGAASLSAPAAPKAD